MSQSFYARMKYHNERQLGEERVHFTLQLIVHYPWKSGQAQGKSRGRGSGDTAYWLARPAFLYNPGLSAQGEDYPKRCPICHSVGGIFPLILKWLYLVSNWHKTSQDINIQPYCSFQSTVCSFLVPSMISISTFLEGQSSDCKRKTPILLINSSLRSLCVQRTNVLG